MANFPLPPVSTEKAEESQAPKPAKKKKARRETWDGPLWTPLYAKDFISCLCNTFCDKDFEARSSLMDFTLKPGLKMKTRDVLVGGSLKTETRCSAI